MSAMPQGPPIYRDRDHLHQADTCSALVNAVEQGAVRLEALARGTYPGKPLETHMLPGLKSIGYWDASHEQDWGLDWHRNEGLELTYLESGEIEFAVSSHEYTLRPGDLTITRPWQPHRVGNPTVGAGRLYWLILDVGVRRPHQSWKWPGWLILSEGDQKALTDMLRQNEQPVWKGSHEVEACFNQIGNLIRKCGTVPTLGSRLALLINELLIILIEILRSRNIQCEESLITAERAAEMFLRELESSVSEPWTLDSMAESAGLKRTRFAHYCKKLKNMTPSRYLSHLRVEKAKQLMCASPELTLTEVGQCCGFGSSQYFATVFRGHTGLAPVEFRRRTGALK
ncbi:MAG: AraC family transcriptional regulator [Candidatus Hydrogenedentes bacterium]|nr:AraC family transcriptional regulator [Candidatus Hydrogenedentota bacterium]